MQLLEKHGFLCMLPDANICALKGSVSLEGKEKKIFLFAWRPW